MPLLRSVKANAQVNQQLVSCLRVALEQRSIQIPISSRAIHDGKIIDQDEQDDDEDDQTKKVLTMQEKAIFLETDALQIELGNVVMRVSPSGTYTYDTARSNQRKDRYSALSMAVRYVSELEEIRKREIKSRSNACIGVVTKI
jgi:hypothetical protein